MYISKNYSTDNGDTLVIGGKLIVKEEAEVEGISTELPVASAAVLGGVKVGEGLSITQGGTLSADSTPIASSEVLGVVKIGSGLSITAEGVLSAESQEVPQATLDSYGTVKMIPYVSDCKCEDLYSFAGSLSTLTWYWNRYGMMANKDE